MYKIKKISNCEGIFPVNSKEILSGHVYARKRKKTEQQNGYLFGFFKVIFT